MHEPLFNNIDGIILYRTVLIGLGFVLFSTIMFYFQWLRNPFFEV